MEQYKNDSCVSHAVTFTAQCRECRELKDRGQWLGCWNSKLLLLL